MNSPLGVSESGISHEYGSVSVGGQAHAQLGDRYINQIEQYNHTVRNTYNHYAPAPLPARPQPSIIIPFPPNRDFVPRDEYATLWDRRNDHGQRIALVGLGGVGKSQLAIEFAYRMREEKPDVWVCWVHASSTARFEESYRTIAESLQIPGRYEPQANIFILVKTWLSQPQSGPWVMVVDNADAEWLILGHESLASGCVDTNTTLPISHHLPPAAHGLLVITTRNMSIAQGLVGYDTNIIQLGPMDVDTGIQLLQKRFGELANSVTRSDLAQLAEQVDHMPLAMTQAVAYIRQRAPRMNVIRYLDALRADDDQCGRLLQAAMHDPWRDGEASNSIIMTWHRSFVHIEKQQPSATRLLSLMSQFDRNGIPEVLLVGQYPPKSQVSVPGEEQFDDDVAILCNFNLVNMNPTGTSFSMHRIVQLATKKWLDIRGETAWWQRRLIEVLDKHLPDVTTKFWHSEQELFSHVSAMISAKPTERHVEEVQAKILLRAARCADMEGNGRQAVELARQSYKINAELFGPTSSEALRSKVVIVEVIPKTERKSSDYVSLCKETLAECEEWLAEDNEVRMEALLSAATMLQWQEDSVGAEEMCRRALVNLRQKFGEAHEYTTSALCILGSILACLFRYSEAEQFLRQALESCLKVYTDNHPFTWIMAASLADLFIAQGKYQEATVLLAGTLDKCAKVYGEQHPHRISMYKHLGICLLRTERYSEGLVLLSRAHSYFKTQEGSDSEEALDCLQWIEYADLLLANDGQPTTSRIFSHDNLQDWLEIDGIQCHGQ